MRNRTVLPLVAVLALLIPVSLTLASDADEGIFAPVKRGDCFETLVFQGEIEASESVSIHAPQIRDANLVTIKSVLEDGERVNAGDVVIRLEDSAFQTSLEAAKEELEVAKSEYEKTRFDLQNDGIDLRLTVERKELELAKAKVLVVEDSIVFSKIELQKAKLNVELAELELKRAREALKEFENKRVASLNVKELQVKQGQRKIDTLREKIDLSVVKAPCDGIVYKPFVRLNNEMGRIEANKVVRPGDKLLELPNLDRFRGILYVPSADYPFVHVGDPASITLTALPDRVFTARLASRELYPISRNERLGRNDAEGYLKEYRVVLDLPDPDPALRPGMTFQAEIACRIATDCLFIPRAAVASEGEDGCFAWVKPAPGHGKPGLEKRRIVAGRTGISFLEVLSGVASGEEVRLDFPSPEEPEDSPDSQ